MKKIVFIFVIFFISINLIKSQITGHETPPPHDPSCLTNVYGCTNWSNWTQDWISANIQSPFDPECNNCKIYVNYKLRFCLNNPTIVEIWVGAFGVFSMGCPCPITNNNIKNNPQFWKMTMYKAATAKSFESVKLEHRCGIDEPMKYNMRFPGSCTMQCIYTRDGNYSVTGDINCYPSGFCCGKTYIYCYDEQLNKVILNEEITIGETNCNYPTGNPPFWLCPNGINGWQFFGTTNCEDNCNYAGQ